MRRVASVVVLAVAIGIGAVRPALAARADAPWRLEDTSGLVSLAANGSCFAAGPGRPLPADVTIATRADGRVTLRRGGESIALSPLTNLTVHASAHGATRVVQQAGFAWFKIRKERRPHFSVETPDLTATVRGTTFTVAVDMAGAGVHVREGAVEVATSWRDAVTLVRAGTMARVARGGHDKIALINGGNVTRIVTGVDGQTAPGIRRSSVAEGDLFPTENAGTPRSVQVAFGGTGLRPSRNPDATDTASPGRPTTLDLREGERGVAPAGKRGRVGLPLVETILAALGLLILISAHTAWGWVRQARAKRAPAAHS